MTPRFTLAAAALALLAPAALAEPVNITPEMATATVQTDAGPIDIARIQDNDNEVTGEWARTSRPCPMFCIQPMSPAEGVRTIGELEMIEALQDPDVIVTDSRVRSDYLGGTIPGAVHLPYTEVTDRLDVLGCELDFDGFICDNASQVVLFCNGPWCGQSPTAINRMIEAGYPADRISYYRGGMQVWRMLGLTVTVPVR
jgi:rhodanese-related sulfurtransferase